MRKIVILFVSVWSLFSYSQDSVPTFSKEVVRIFQNRCQQCHHENSIAPFSLVTYQDALTRRNRIKSAVVSGRMPPWKAEKGCREYSNDTSLPQSEIDTIAKWVDSQAPEGDRSELPPPLKFSDDWILGEPDLVVQNEAYTIPVNQTGDDYRCFSLPNTFDNDVYLRAYQFVAGQKSIVHHVELFLDPHGDSVGLDAKDSKPGYKCSISTYVRDEKILAGWAPGQPIGVYPDGFGIKIPAKTRIVMQVHYQLTKSVDLEDVTKGALYFAKEVPKNVVTVEHAYSGDFTVPANDKNFELITMSEPFQKLTLLPSVAPHMHLLGRKVEMTAILPDGSRQCLVRIGDWDFHWQNYYMFTQDQRVVLPPGSRIETKCTYDNSETSKYQFNKPPKDVKFGESTTDEMCNGFWTQLEL